MRTQTFDIFFDKHFEENLRLHKCNQRLSNINPAKLTYLLCMRRLGFHIGSPQSCLVCHKTYLKELRKNYSFKISKYARL
jgi:hypothetical protein